MSDRGLYMTDRGLNLSLEGNYRYLFCLWFGVVDGKVWQQWKIP